MKQPNLVIFIFLIFFQICPQKTSAQDYYPLEVGNQWNYSHMEFDPNVENGLYLDDTLIIKVIKDTILNNNHYFVLDNFDLSGGKIVRMDSNNIYYYDETNSSEVLFFRFDAKIKDYWTTHLNGINHKIELVSIDSLIYLNFLTRVFKFKIYDYFWNYIEISKDFGIIRWILSGGMQIHKILIGCKLSNNYYGDISSFNYNIKKAYEIYLYQNYPNPFNYRTNIVFQIPKPLYVDLYLFNSLGNKISTIYSGRKETGIYSFPMDGSKYSSGIYYLRLITNEFVATKKCILLK
jgi:hypothetical protein